MNLVILYGPPAVGKLTIARELEKLTDYRVIDMNLALVLANQLFAPKTFANRYLNRELRLVMLEKAAQYDLPGVILTHGYSHHENNPFIQSIIDLMKRYNGRVYFVYVMCAVEELERRVGLPSRVQHIYKIKDVESLHNLLAYRIFPKIDFVESFEIDTTELKPEDAAKKILNYISKEI